MTKSKPIMVPVIVHKDASGDYSITKIKDLKFNKKDDKIPGDWVYAITFRIQNPHPANFVFASDEDGFWVQDAAKGCPTKYQPHPSFVYDGTSADGLELYVTNRDPSCQQLKYTLNLVDADGVRKPISLDPIMNNQNGGASFWEANSVAIIGAVGGLFAIAGLAALISFWRDTADD
ncbi:MULTISPECIES: hypothetical protein [Sphingomonas]|uniref:hypothetical protein n=1 Tax=Sphingomonas TaxID=13687 RepID=UPI000DEFE604|nr:MULTISPECIES: hypothetical protein [Sphingomonas]